MAAIAVATTKASTLTANTVQLYTLPTGAKSAVVQNLSGSPAAVFVGFAGTDGDTSALVAAFEVGVGQSIQVPLPRLTVRNVYLRSTGAATVVVGWSRSDVFVASDLSAT